MDFKIDHRGNPRLHRLYVRYAIEHLKPMMECVDDLEGQSRVNALVTAGLLRQRMRELVLEDSAYFEAGALLFAGADTTSYFVDEKGKPSG